MILLYDHESSIVSLCMQETLFTGGVPCLQEKGKENKGNKHAWQKCFHGSKKYTNGSHHSPVFEYVVFHFLLNNMYGGQ